jgi:hypothetical protein
MGNAQTLIPGISIQCPSFPGGVRLVANVFCRRRQPSGPSSFGGGSFGIGHGATGSLWQSQQFVLVSSLVLSFKLMADWERFCDGRTAHAMRFIS